MTRSSEGDWIAVSTACVALAVSLAAPALAQQPPGVDAVRELQAALTAERQRVAELQIELERRGAALARIAARLDALTDAAAEVVVSPQETVKATPPEPARFDFYGDSLLRVATLHQGYDGCVGCPDRTIGRMRLRFGVEGQLAPGVRAVIGLGTGELNDPNTVYQTFGGNLGRKVATWDRAYISYRPTQAPWLDVIGGKFPYPWVRSSMTFDIDFYPEGLSERVSFARKTGLLSGASVQGMQIVVNEQANGPDTMLIGAQAIAGLRLGRRVATRIIASAVDVHRPEHVLRSQLDGSNVGVRNTNAIVPAGNSSSYASGFRYANAIVENALQTPWQSVPITLAFEYQRNLRAVSNRDTGTSIRLDMGRSARRGDWTASWHVFRVEQDAIVSALGESDWRAPSNVLQQRIGATVTLHEHVQGLFTWYRGRTLDRSLPGAVLVPNLPPGTTEPWANRLYFDVLYRF